MNGEIVRYVKDGKGRKVGILVGVQFHPGERVEIGWSRCMACDPFNRGVGLEKARENVGKPVPPSFLKAAREFRVQCFLCFRDNLGVQRVEVMQYAKQPRKVSHGKVKNGGHRKGCGYVKGHRKCPCLCNCRELAKAEEAAESVVEQVQVSGRACR